jgi:hypothetical protein
MTLQNPASRERFGSYEPRNSYGLMAASEGGSPYADWGQTAAYFDGDGAVIPLIQYYNLLFHLTWADSYLPQLDQLKAFLESQELHPAKIAFNGSAYFLPLYRQDDVLEAARKMLPMTYKKFHDLRTVIGYLENSITGSEAIERLNESVRAGRRRAPIRYVHMPFIRNEGAYAGRVLGARRAAKGREIFNDEQKKDIITQKGAGVSVAELARVYDVSLDTIYRVLKEGKSP